MGSSKSPTFNDVVQNVRDLQEHLKSEGWLVVNALGEQADPTTTVWFSATYTSGEYTLHAFYRDGGFGRAEGNIRVRVTPALLEHYPTVGVDLAAELVYAARDRMNADRSIKDMPWPPPLWNELSREGVKDIAP